MWRGRSRRVSSPLSQRILPKRKLLENVIRITWMEKNNDANEAIVKLEDCTEDGNIEVTRQ
jgi:hypothetical protein